MRFHLEVKGERACFRRPEFKRDLISYDVMPPAAASRFLSLLYSAAGIGWLVDQITIAAEIKLGWGDLAARGGREGGPAWLIQQPRYGIAARMAALDATDEGDLEHHAALFTQAVLGGESKMRPFLGLPECAATFNLMPTGQPIQPYSALIGVERDLGWLPYDSGIPVRSAVRYYRGIVRDGVLDVPQSPPELLAM
ncbi:CRISPR-associated protein Cas5 [Sphingomonas aerophila]|uniref:CRISPR-associated protein Cas5d n=1 Tax=Sphingomonas aerophila TaxID=1344948 RepID=A0A7W9BEZ3_9SPHN|nr:CRISPR-associated protein Cas5 [Sphingomonas aerophila]MBB5715953.1 CRISPR-associated protein Cas5d [Sphingomonas aerophila]